MSITCYCKGCNGLAKDAIAKSARGTAMNAAHDTAKSVDHTKSNLVAGRTVKREGSGPPFARRSVNVLPGLVNGISMRRRGSHGSYTVSVCMMKAVQKGWPRTQRFNCYHLPKVKVKSTQHTISSKEDWGWGDCEEKLSGLSGKTVTGIHPKYLVLLSHGYGDTVGSTGFACLQLELDPCI